LSDPVGLSIKREASRIQDIIIPECERMQK